MKTKPRLRAPWTRARDDELLHSVDAQKADADSLNARQPTLPPVKQIRGTRSLAIPSWLLMSAGLTLVLLAWIYVSSHQVAQFGLVPSPLVTLTALFSLLARGPFWDDLLTTLYRMIIGFTVSVVLGIPMGIGIGLSRTLSAMFGGIIDSLKYTPISAFIPLSIILFGVGDAQKVAVLLLATGPYMAVMTADAVRSSRVEYIEGALTLGASRVQVISHVILASAAPQIWQAARLALAIAWTYIVTAELIGAEAGLGRFLLRAERFFNVKEMFATVIIIAVIGWLSDLGFRLAYRRWFRWAVLTSQEQHSGK